MKKHMLKNSYTTLCGQTWVGHTPLGVKVVAREKKVTCKNCKRTLNRYNRKK